MRSIVLFGMAGVGKSTVAAIVAAALGREHVDTDDEVERRRGKSIGRIFDEDGEASFRASEREVVGDLARRADLVVSVGGGAMLDDGNVASLRPRSAFVLLDAPADVVAVRAASSDRPLLRGDLAAHVATLSAERAPTYERLADARLLATASADDVAAAVVQWARRSRGILSPAERARA